ncbi:MAG TPA: hypothetical protein VF762_11495 [Blastocatellia bacterium]|jgi:hypothetical protein
MKKLFSPAVFLKCPRPSSKALRAATVVFLSACVVGPILKATPAAPRPTKQKNLSSGGQASPAKPFICGYNSSGAEDEWHNHRLNEFRSNGRRAGLQINGAGAGRKAEFHAQAVGDIAVIEDDGTIIAPPSKFDLKNRSLLFTPDGDGYSVTHEKVDFNTDFGFRLGYFFGADGKLLGNADNGYRDITLLGAQFTFFGASYDQIFIGTNGYITFGGGDTNARLSASALATALPRIAPLWADLDASQEGDIYYNRLAGRHVITWDAVPQALYSGKSTFQAVLYDDGRIAFVYKNVKARSSLIGLSPGGSAQDAQPVDLSAPPAERITGAFFESFSKQKRLDLPALTRAFYGTYPDMFDTIYVWTDFSYDNGLGVAHSFNVRNDIAGIGLKIFDRGADYGSPSRMSSIITMGNQNDWPSDPQEHVVGLNSAISIVCHEQGHRWLAYVRFDAEHDIKDDLLGRDNSHWSFLVDTRTNAEGTFSSLMEGNSWRDNGNGTFATVESAVNYFSPLDEYLMGLRPAEEVGNIPYLVTDAQLKFILREKSPVSGFSMSATRKNATVAQIVEREGVRVPAAADAPKEFRIAFILLTEQGSQPSGSTLGKMSKYSDALVRYFSVATGRLGSLNNSLPQ